MRRATRSQVNSSGTKIVGWGIENGKVNGNQFLSIGKRDPPNADTLTYQLTGKVEWDIISAKARTSLSGNEAQSE